MSFGWVRGCGGRGARNGGEESETLTACLADAVGQTWHALKNESPGPSKRVNHKRVRKTQRRLRDSRFSGTEKHQSKATGVYLYKNDTSL